MEQEVSFETGFAGIIHQEMKLNQIRDLSSDAGFQEITVRDETHAVQQE